jgi:hypothetical protein
LKPPAPAAPAIAAKLPTWRDRSPRRTEFLPFDESARRMVLSSAKRVALVTAISPRALIDLLFVGSEILRLIRRLATLYGGRPGTLGFIRLARETIGHLAVTGGIAAGDSLVQQIVGHGVAARLSARLGEGVVNGMLTARVGIAAIEVCRPPFINGTPPRLSDVMAARLGLGGKKTPADRPAYFHNRARPVPPHRSGPSRKRHTAAICARMPGLSSALAHEVSALAGWIAPITNRSVPEDKRFGPTPAG